MLVFNDPVLSRRRQSPADFVILGQPMLLGYTEVLYLGQRIAGTEKRRALPSFAGVLNLAEPSSYAWPTLAEQTIGRNFQVQVTAEGRHVFDWNVIQPPLLNFMFVHNDQSAGGWLSDQRRSTVQAALALRGCNAANHEAMAEALQQMTPGFCRVLIQPLPGWQRFDDQVKNHEMQHVADHKALAECIFGPLDAWQIAAKNKRVLFRGPERGTLKNKVNLANYATTANRIVRYWVQCCDDSGEMFHASRDGAPPILRFVRIFHHDGDYVVHFTVEAQTLIGDRDMDSGAHQNFFNLKPIGGSSPINGNDPHLAANNARPNRRIDLFDVHNLANDSVVEISELNPEESDSEEESVFGAAFQKVHDSEY